MKQTKKLYPWSLQSPDVMYLHNWCYCRIADLEDSDPDSPQLDALRRNLEKTNELEGWLQNSRDGRVAWVPGPVLADLKKVALWAAERRDAINRGRTCSLGA